MNDRFKVILATINVVFCILAIIWVWQPEVFHDILGITGRLIKSFFDF